jgi:hypothetical protein
LITSAGAAGAGTATGEWQREQRMFFPPIAAEADSSFPQAGQANLKAGRGISITFRQVGQTTFRPISFASARMRAPQSH